MNELFFILVLGGLQPIVEVTMSRQAAGWYNVVAVIIVLSYCVWKVLKNPGALRNWGFRFDNFWSALIAHLCFAIPASVAMYAFGWYVDRTPLPATFWYLIALYPLWGIGQQFALQNLLTRNLQTIIPHAVLCAIVTALLFGAAHLPAWELSSLAFTAGLFFTMIYRRHANLFAVGIAHGLVGAFAFYLVLGQDQWEILMQYFT